MSPGPMRQNFLCRVSKVHGQAYIRNSARVMRINECPRGPIHRLSQLLRYNPSAWSRKQNKIVLRLDDVHSARKLLKDIPDYLVDSGSRGDAIIFDARELEDFLGSSISPRGNPLRAFVRLFGRQT